MSEAPHGNGQSATKAGSGVGGTTGSRPAVGGRREHIALGLLALAFVALCVGSASRKSVTVDELGHLPSGLYTLASGDVRHASLNPPLLNVLAALPVLTMSLDTPIEPPEASDDVFDFWSAGYHFHERHRSDYLRIYDLARWVPVLLAVALGVLVFRWANEVANTAEGESPAVPAAGFVAVSLLWFSPNWIAQARLVGTDTGTALFMAASLYGLRAMLREPSKRNLVLFGVFLGLAQLTKFYALLLYPLALGLALFRLRGGGLARRSILTSLVGAYALSLVILNLGYGFSEFGRSLSALTLQSEVGLALQQGALGGVPLPLPGGFVRALDGQWVEVSSGLLLGDTFQGGRLDYYLIVLWLKTSLVGLAAFAVACGSTLRRARLDRWELALLLAFPVALFVALSASGSRQLGLRALLSAFPFLCVFMGAALASATPPAMRVRLMGGAVAVCVATAVLAFPDYLAHFNPLVGGRDAGYRLASDANIDIGQDLEELARWLEEEGVGPVQLFYFGSVDPALYGIDYRVPEDYRLEPGYVAVSVSLYRMSYDVYDHGRLRKVGPVDLSALGAPVATIGGSIHVYRVPGAAG